MPRKVRKASESVDTIRTTKKTYGPGKPKGRRALNLEEIADIATLRKEVIARREPDEESHVSTLILDESEEAEEEEEEEETIHMIDDVTDAPADGFVTDFQEEDVAGEEEEEETVYDNSEEAAYSEMIKYCKANGPGRGNQMVKNDFKYYKNQFKQLIEQRNVVKIPEKLGKAIKGSMQEKFDSDSRAMEKIKAILPEYDDLSWKLRTSLLDEVGREDFEDYAMAETEKERDKIAQLKGSLVRVKGPNFSKLRKNHLDKLLRLPHNYTFESFEDVWKDIKASYVPIIIKKGRSGPSKKKGLGVDRWL